MTIRRLALCAAALSLVAGAAHAADPQNGRKLFMEHICYSCHGTAGAGGGAAGPKIAPGPLPLAAFTRQLRHPNRMPPYTDKLISDAEVADIHAYLSSVPAAKSPSQIPLLSK